MAGSPEMALKCKDSAITLPGALLPAPALGRVCRRGCTLERALGALNASTPGLALPGALLPALALGRMCGRGCALGRALGVHGRLWRLVQVAAVGAWHLQNNSR